MGHLLKAELALIHAIGTCSLIALGCGEPAEAPIGNTQVIFEAPVTYQRDDFDFDVGCPDLDCCDRVIIREPPIQVAPPPPPVEAGTLVIAYWDLPPGECEIEVTIQTDEATCLGTGTRPADKNAVVTIEFDCEE